MDQLQQNIQLIEELQLNKDDIIDFIEKRGMETSLEELDKETLECIIQEYNLSLRSSIRRRKDVSTISNRASRTQNQADISSADDQNNVTLDIDQTIDANETISNQNRESNNDFTFRGTVDIYKKSDISRNQSEQSTGQFLNDQQFNDILSSIQMADNFSVERASTNFYGQALEEMNSLPKQVQNLLKQDEIISSQSSKQFQEALLYSICERDEELLNSEIQQPPLTQEQETSQLLPDCNNINYHYKPNNQHGQQEMMQYRSSRSQDQVAVIEYIRKQLEQQQFALSTQSSESIASFQINKSANSQDSQGSSNSNKLSYQTVNDGSVHSSLSSNQNSDQTQKGPFLRGQSLIQIQCKPIKANKIGQYIDENNGKRPIIKISKYQVNEKKILYTIDTNLFNQQQSNDTLIKSGIKSTFNNEVNSYNNNSEIKSTQQSEIKSNNSLENSMIIQYNADTIVRSHLDFIRLHTILKETYIGYFIPPLPDKLPIQQQDSILTNINNLISKIDKKKSIQNFKKTKLEKLKIQLQQFLDSIMNSKVLRNSKILEDFLKIQDENYYNTTCNRYSRPPNYSEFKKFKTEDFYSMDGIFNCEAAQSPALKNYSKIFTQYNEKAIDKYIQVKKQATEAIKHLENASSSLVKLGDAFLDLHRITKEFNEQNKIGVNSFLSEQYKECGQFMNNLSQTIQRQHSLISETIDIPLRYESMISKSFENLTNNLKVQLNKYEDKIQKLMADKQKLFDSQNIKEWQVDPSVNLPAEVKTNKHLAFRYILHDRTIKVKELEKKVSFLLGVLFQESFIYMKDREFKNTKNFIQYIKQNSRILQNLQTQHANCLKKIDETQKKSQDSILAQIQEDTHELLIDRSRTLHQGYFI